MQIASVEACPRIGLAYSTYVPELIRARTLDFDYVEVPFEALEHDPQLIDALGGVEVVLHCASLSMAGNIPVADPTYRRIQYWLDQTKSPWLGEHLSFSAVVPEFGPADQYAPGEPYNIGYTVTPPFNDETMDAVLANLNAARHHILSPIILENSPVYLTLPGSSLSQAEFISRLCASCDVGLLLDLAHLLITSQNTRQDPFDLLAQLPLDKVVEIHLSGLSVEQDGAWDDHAAQAPEIEFEMLNAVLDRTTPRAITLEYNWSSAFPMEFLQREIDRTRSRLGRYERALG